MPVIEVHLLEGYSAEEHRRLGEALTDATRLVVPAPAEAITVMFHQMQSDHYYRGRSSKTPAAALPDPCTLVHKFLSCLGDRDLKAAEEYIAAEFSMHFPGAEPMHSLQSLIEWSAPRYKSITKTFDSTEAFADENGKTIVYCRGTLAGVWPDNNTFKNIRFIDRFEIVAGKITRQEVWNDLAESRPVTQQVTRQA